MKLGIPSRRHPVWRGETELLKLFCEKWWESGGGHRTKNSGMLTGLEKLISSWWIRAGSPFDITLWSLRRFRLGRCSKKDVHFISHIFQLVSFLFTTTPVSDDRGEERWNWAVRMGFKWISAQRRRQESSSFFRCHKNSKAADGVLVCWWRE